MKTYNLHYNNFKTRQSRTLVLVLFFVLGFWSITLAQVTSSIDSTRIKIGEQITYKIQVEADTTELVVFPEGQTFLPLEMIESYKIDTTTQNAKYNLVKKYGLTQFDSGAYTIPKQKIIIGNKTFFTDSLQVEVNSIAVDTTKQALYDIKPFIEVEKTTSNWWLPLLYVLLALAVVAFLLYWFVWRKKPLTQEEKIALLPPYDRAKLALKTLDDSTYLQNEELKEYYSELTFIIRRYLDEKVYDRALESTTDELVTRLNLLKDGNQIDISKEDIKNIESILKRADLVKFAKSAPDIELAKLDRNTIDLEIDQVKEALPEATEEEKLLDQKYKEEQAEKKKRKQIMITVVVGVLLVLGILIGFGIKYGFTYVKDSIVGHESKELLEGDWVTSEYGIPPIYISTPKVLKRMEVAIPEELKEKLDVTTFGYGSLIEQLNIVVATTAFKDLGENKIELNQVVEKSLAIWGSQGVQNMFTKKEKFATPNNAEGLKVFGTADFPSLIEGKTERGQYIVLAFTAENVVQQIVVTWREGDDYAKEIVDRVINSVELKKEEN
ncbi:BatD family protein [Lacinutrix undariae]